MSLASPSDRRSQLAQIHIARKALEEAQGLTEDAYRDLLAGKFCGKRSAADLNDRQRLELLDHFQRMGWKGRVGGSRANAPKKAAWSPKVKKLFSVWQQLADAKLVNDRTAKALSSWCRRQTAGAGGVGGVERVEWLNPHQLHACTEAAKKWLTRGEEPSKP